MFSGHHIFLTGFMGSGKSLLGKKIAVLFQRHFIDLDAYIEEQEHKTIARIFQEEGEDAFRKTETRCLREVIDSSQETVVALGGGTVCFGDNLELVKQAGFLVYIQLNAAALAERLKKNKQKRPLLTDMPEHEMTQRIAILLEQRLPFYSQAHLIINGLNLTPQVLYQKIRETSG